MRVLDVACGTGVLARELAPDIEWTQGTAEELPFPDQSFDVVVSQFGLMVSPDRMKSLREMLRVMKPGGHLAVAVWDSLDNIPAIAAEVVLLERVAGRAASDALRAPFVPGDKADRELRAYVDGSDRAVFQISAHVLSGSRS